eukprot:m.19491 g.19491  ORF g.19491 m.19491 type:complete len:377 (+) comp5126_c0_seq1:161-1291(+)
MLGKTLLSSLCPSSSSVLFRSLSPLRSIVSSLALCSSPSSSSLPFVQLVLTTPSCSRPFFTLFPTLSSSSTFFSSPFATLAFPSTTSFSIPAVPFSSLQSTLLFQKRVAMSDSKTEDPKPIKAVAWKTAFASISDDVKGQHASILDVISPLVKDRRYHLVSYKACFDIREAIDKLMLSSTSSSREDATKLLQGLLEAGKIYHVLADHDTIVDQQLFFRVSNPETPSVFSIANEKQSFLEWVVAKTSSFGFSKQIEFVIGVDAATKTLNSFKTDISGEPIQSIPIDSSLDVTYADNFGVDVTSHKESLSLRFPSSVSREQFVEALVGHGAVVLEEQTDLVKNAKSIFEFEAKTNAQDVLKFDAIKPKVCIIVNTASG